MPIWLALSATLLLTAVVYIYESYPNKKLKGVPTFDVLTNLLSSLLDQPVSQSFGAFQRVRFTVNWIIWIMCLVVLGQFYKGVIFSFLTQAKTPNWPTNLGELVSNNYTLVTTTTAYQDIEEFPLLKLLIMDFIRASNSSSTNQLYKLFHDKLQYFKRSWFYLTLASLSKSQRNSTSDWPQQNLVIIGNSIRTALISTIISHYSNKDVVSNPMLLSHFDVWTPWKVRRTYFFSIFSKHRLSSTNLACGIKLYSMSTLLTSYYS